MKKFTISKVVLLVFALAANSIFGQKLEKSDLVFGKAYTVDELKKMNGVIRCASTEYEQYLQKKDPSRMTDAQFEAWLQPLIENAKLNRSTNNGIITIPVVVHVIHSGENYGVAPNITDAQVQSQITVMNNDFRKAANTPGFNTNPVGADTMIQFALAKADPNGNPTNGINRVNLCSAFWVKELIDAYVKPTTIWDPTKYMNMWSVKFGGSSSNLLGYAQFPSNSNLTGLNTNGGAPSTDGVVANYATFGSSDYNDGTFILGAPYDKGRTMTHEVGHFLGLRHIWGDGNTTAVCETDFCNDTPPAHDANYSCATVIASCTAGLNEMTENYMDYTNDTCMNIFTNDQKSRMTAVMNNSPRRSELKTSTKDVAIPLFANDVEIKLENECTAPVCNTPQGIKISLYNRGNVALTSATISYSVNGVAQNYNWTGNLAQDKYQVVTLPALPTFTAGPATINVTAVNGGADQRTTNNNISFAYVGAPAVSGTSNVVFNLQLDYYGSETSWTLKNSAGATVYSGGSYADVVDPNTMPIPAVITENWILNQNDCYTFTINDTYGDGLSLYGGYYKIKTPAGVDIVTGSNFGTTQSRVLKYQVLGTNEAKKDVFGVYPNPADDILNITKVSNSAKFEIHNAVGQLVKGGDVTNNKVKVAELVKGTYIITIKDKNVSESIKFIKK